MLAVNQEGLPLGVIRSDCIAPEIKAKTRQKSPSEIPIEEKKIFSWIEDIRDTMEIKSCSPDTKLINIMDREGDFFELFNEQRTNCQDIRQIEYEKVSNYFNF